MMEPMMMTRGKHEQVQAYRGEMLASTNPAWSNRAGRIRSYTERMGSKAAADVRRAQLARYAAMTPEQRLDAAMRMTEEGLHDYMATHGIDRATAIARIRATRRVGRRPSGSDDAAHR